MIKGLLIELTKYKFTMICEQHGKVWIYGITKAQMKDMDLPLYQTENINGQWHYQTDTNPATDLCYQILDAIEYLINLREQLHIKEYIDYLRPIATDKTNYHHIEATKELEKQERKLADLQGEMNQGIGG